MKIIEMLYENSRTPFKDIAEKVGLSTSGVRRRTKKLEEKGIIKNYTIKIDPEQIGYGAVAFLSIDTEPGEMGRVAGALSRNASVCEVHRTTGSSDLIIKVRAEDIDTIDDFVTERIGAYEGVRKVSFTPATKTYKEEPWVP